MFKLTYPIEGNGTESKEIQVGELCFLLGANGAGKSTLMQNFATQNTGKVRKITAHRQVWFNSNTIDLTPASREQSEININNQDKQLQARWRDDYAAQRSQVTIFDLIDSENVEARKIADAARSKDLNLVQQLASVQAPMERMNDILKLSNLDIQITVDQGSKLLATRNGSEPYSIAELSDGERNAIIIIANILTAPQNTLILLDEPERHLHRAIVSPLISTLLSYRNDCTFVISTHDVSLPLDQAKSSALLVRQYSHSPKFWSVDQIEEVQTLDEEVAKAILGSRKTVMFVEGIESSLDVQLYQIFFPKTSIRALGNCVEVERTVTGLNSAENNHWISGVGIIDRDNRTDEECASLKDKGIICLSQYSVESIYYHPITIALMITRVALIHGINISETQIAINNAIIQSIEKHRDRLAALMTQRKAKELLASQAPDWKDIIKETISVNFSTNELLATEQRLIAEYICDKNIEKLISRYPIRETPALELVSKELRFRSKKDYEQSVRKMLIESEDNRSKVMVLLKPVEQYLNAL